jgi:hypothetical protein
LIPVIISRFRGCGLLPLHRPYGDVRNSECRKSGPSVIPRIQIYPKPGTDFYDQPHFSPSGVEGMGTGSTKKRLLPASVSAVTTNTMKSPPVITILTGDNWLVGCRWECNHQSQPAVGQVQPCKGNHEQSESNRTAGGRETTSSLQPPVQPQGIPDSIYP